MFKLCVYTRLDFNFCVRSSPLRNAGREIKVPFGENPELPKVLLLKPALVRVFIDFNKAFERVWHTALWVAMKKNNIRTNFIRVIKKLYDKATSTVLFNSSIGDWFRTTVGVRQGCLLSSTLFNVFLERIMTDALEDYEDS